MRNGPVPDSAFRYYQTALIALLLIFVLRVIAQLCQLFFDFDFLPPFDAWQSGTLPYSWLLFFQVCIVTLCALTIRKFVAKSIIPSIEIGTGLGIFGSLYFSAMLFRLFAGATFASDVPWFQAKIPAAFHLVLASFMLVLAHFHRRYGSSNMSFPMTVRKISTWIVYPFVMLVALGLYYGLVWYGLSITLSSYIAAMLGGFGLITLFEIVLPYRKEWLPNRAEIKTDLLFIVTMQVLLPYFLSLITVLLLQSLFQQRNWSFVSYWPHTYPVWIQMLLMMFAADFLRYWLHRAMHTWTPLWSIHAVHHSVQKMYWVNVARFHPIDKSMQFVCDALPFIVLGVSKEVLTLYFVVYAIKGFFQHSNVDAKLGWLNYIISGPELHRWHHSKRIKESNSNYGNNIIVWDILFGTYFLPKDREVGELGLINRNYPMGFIQQMKAPFIKGLDKEK